MGIKYIIDEFVENNKEYIRDNKIFRLYQFNENLIDNLISKSKNSDPVCRYGDLQQVFMKTNFQEVFKRAFLKESKYILNIERQIDFNAFMFDMVFKFYANTCLLVLTPAYIESRKIILNFIENPDIFNLIYQTNDLIITLNLSKKDFIQLTPIRSEDKIIIQIFGMPYERYFSSDIAYSCINGFEKAVDELEDK